MSIFTDIEAQIKILKIVRHKRNKYIFFHAKSMAL